VTPVAPETPTECERAQLALGAALAEALTGTDPAAILSGTLITLADDLVRTCPGIDHDWELRLLIGQLHFMRFGALLKGADPAAAIAEIRLIDQWLGPVMAGAPDMVPQPIQQFLEQIGKVYATSDPTVLGERVRQKREAVAITPHGHPGRLIMLTSLGIELRMLFDQTKDLDVLREAVDVGRQVVAATSPEHPDFGVHLSVLTIPLRQLVGHTSDLSTLWEAVQEVRNAIKLPAEHPSYLDRLSALEPVLLALYERTADLDALQEAIAFLRRFVATGRHDDLNRGGDLSDLSLALRFLFQRTGDSEALLEAVDTGRKAAAIISPEHFGPCLANLCGTLAKLFEQTGDPDVLRDAERTGRNAVDATPSEHPARAMCLSNLTFVLTKRGEQTGDLDVLREAVQVGRDAVRIAPPGHSYRALGLAHFSLALVKSGELTGDPELLWEAVQVSRDALVTIPSGHSDRTLYLDVLGNAQRMLYDRTGDVSALRDAVRALREAVGATLPGQAERGAHLASLGLTLLRLYDHAGDMPTLREAIRVGEQAVAATPSGHHDYAGRASNLSTLLLRTATRTGEQAILRESVRLARNVVAAMPTRHPRHAGLLSNLGNALVVLFHRTSEETLLRQAVQASREAVAASAKPLYLMNLGWILQNLFEHTKDLAVLREAVQADRDAVATALPDHPLRALFLGNLSNSLLRLHDHTKNLEDVDNAVRAGWDAIAGTRPEHPDHAGQLITLGFALVRWAGHTADPHPITQARRLFAAAAGLETAPAAHRVRAAGMAAELDLLAGDHEHATAIIESAVELLPRMASRELGLADRRYGVTRAPGLASTAAAVFIATGRPDRAVELLEQTRGLMLASTLDIRADLTDLRRDHPDLADKLDALRHTIDTADHETGATEDLAWYRDLSDRRAHLNQRWETLLAQIRTRDHGFLRPPAVDELRRQAANGPIVYVTAHTERGHALIVASDGVHVVDLPGLTAAATAHHADMVRHTDDSDLLAVLTWLWDTVANPVLCHLGHTAPPPENGPWPRIWWCPVGAVTLLPLHAAGRHTEVPNTVMDRVVSSYTPTIRALAHARRPTSSAPPESMVIVAVPDPPDEPVLAFVDFEADVLCDLIPSATVLPTPTSQRAVIDGLQHHQLAHFACHSIADMSNPAASRLLLHDHPLTVHTITELHLADAHLAYLSACSTTAPNPHQPDEPAHITTAFQLAGYRTVIGTLWPIHDRTAVDIAEDIYNQLTRDGATPPDPAIAAHALHHAVRRLRDKNRTQPAHWAAYTHTGQ
jgi:tetratricopeptide (TPR) repeat protein